MISLSVFLLTLAVVLAGAIAAIVWAQSRAKASAEASAKALQEQMRDTFSAIASDALQQNLERFQAFAGKDLKQITETTAQEAGHKKDQFEKVATDIRTILKELETRSSQVERLRQENFTRLESQLTNLHTQEQMLAKETQALRSALSTSSSVRGRWGELVLRNILQQSELVSGIDFFEQQVSTGLDGGKFQPDFIIRLPFSEQKLVIDSKVPLWETLTDGSLPGQTDEDYCRRLRQRVQELTSKEYQRNIEGSLPYVILFVPSEAAVRAAFTVDSNVFAWAMERKVFLASPMTLLPLILLVSHSARQHRLSEQTRELARQVELLGNRMRLFMDRLQGVQKGITSATKAWNDAIDKSWSGPQGVTRTLDKVRELGGDAAFQGDLPPVTEVPRDLPEQTPQAELQP